MSVVETRQTSATLSVDLETYSPVDLRKSGVYPYAEHPDFEILLFGYCLDGEPQVIDLCQGEELPGHLVNALFDPAVIKTAFNAAFELACLSRHFGRQLPSEQWRCTSALALTLGLPQNLADVARVCGFPTDRQKMSIGHSLIRYFCLPCKPTKINGGRLRNYPRHAPDRWARFKQYCAQDVIVEKTIREKLVRWLPPAHEQRLWDLDQLINQRGMQIDVQLVDSAIAIDEEIKAKNTAEFAAITGITKATQVASLKAWLSDEHEIEVDTLDKDAVKRMLKLNLDADVERALQLRQELSKSSTSKYLAMRRGVCLDNRIRGLLQFYGANRTGRWAGRLVQIQNLPKSNLCHDDLALARNLVKARDAELLEALFGYVPGILSQLIRTAFVPRPGHFFTVVDFRAIEARVLAWAAREEWRNEVFRTHGRIYEASAAAMFKVPIETIGKHSPLRQKGKVAELALGYLGGEGALITMGALDMGLRLEELQPLVKAWREANPNVVKFARQMEADAKRCLRTKLDVGPKDRYIFRYESGMLFMLLPSGRSLCYVKPKIEREGDFLSITYEGMDQMTKQWSRIPTYAGKLLENYCQAVARDCLAEALPALEEAALPVVGHVHDEAIIEAAAAVWPRPEEALRKAVEIFSRSISWAPELVLGGDGFISDFYRKDA